MDFGPSEVMRVLGVTDALGIHREAVRVPLDNHGSGSVRLVRDGRILEIVAPEEGDFGIWLAGLKSQILALDCTGLKRS